MNINRTGRYVRVQKFDSQYLVLAEVQVWGNSGSGHLKYVLQDLQGTTRALMNNNAVGTSTIISRHDFLPFGEEIWAGTGTLNLTRLWPHGCDQTEVWVNGAR